MHMWEQLEAWHGSPALLFHMVGSPARFPSGVGLRGRASEGQRRFTFPALGCKGHFLRHSLPVEGI